MEENPWQTLSSAIIYDNPWIRVTEHQVLNPSGKPGIYGVVHYKHLAIGVIPVDSEGYTWLVGQYRYPLNVYSWEIPEGGGDLDDTPEATALRELQEETGLTADNLQRIVTSHLSNSVSDEIAHVFLATGLHPGPSAPEENEQLQIRHLPLAEAFALVHQGIITDSMSVAGLLKLELMLLKGEVVL
jgi:ADP-ribose pyrophosphatase